MESKALKKIFTKIETHGFAVMKHKDWKEVGVAITPAGSVVVFEDIDGMLYAVFVNNKSRYHIHIPYDDIFTLHDERVVKVLEEVQQCLHLAECYLEDGIVYSINKFRIRDFIPFGLSPWKSPFSSKK